LQGAGAQQPPASAWLPLPGPSPAPQHRSAREETSVQRRGSPGQQPAARRLQRGSGCTAAWGSL